MGSILACSGFLLASFSHNIALLYLFFGVVSGKHKYSMQRMHTNGKTQVQTSFMFSYHLPDNFFFFFQTTGSG